MAKAAPSTSQKEWNAIKTCPGMVPANISLNGMHAATVGVVTETNAEKAIEELKAYEVLCLQLHMLCNQHLPLFDPS